MNTSPISFLAHLYVNYKIRRNRKSAKQKTNCLSIENVICKKQITLLIHVHCTYMYSI